ncbi:serine hydrolase domain-containing protein [Streptomyces alboflavus]|uniref:serine hydrolase domain-containing protein n=1 Tax=Streptomyces alboflavus TaxID=67267 RepID=UPI0036885F79
MREQAEQNFRSSGRQRSGGRRRVVMAAATVAAGVMSLGALAPSAASASSASASSAATAARPDAVQKGLNALVRDGGPPGALASVKDRDGHVRSYTAGVGDLATGAKVPKDGQVRIGSNTKTFTAVVVLQLVAEKKIRLDASVDTYLPGLVRGDGIDGRRITVRHLLQHTSGLPNYTDTLDFPAIQHRYFEPRELVDMALKHKAHSAPGKKWEYNNTNYVLAGLIIQKVTGRPLAEEIDKRVVQRVGLRHTYFPAVGDQTIRERHPKGYVADPQGGPPRDFTTMDPSWAWAAGQMISTNADLNRFFGALLSGRLLPKAQLDQMRTTIPAERLGPGVGYGLGLVSRPLSCGGVSWGHGGDIDGYETRGGVTKDGRAANVAVTRMPGSEAEMKRVEKVVDTALCR